MVSAKSRSWCTSSPIQKRHSRDQMATPGSFQNSKFLNFNQDDFLEEAEPVPSSPTISTSAMAWTLYNQYENNIRPYIDFVDSLRTLGVEKDLALPAIAVIGDQSSGKSSVLEALSGVTLPRGYGIVTRCPLTLKLKKTCPGQKWKGIISYKNNHKELQNPSEVENEIRKAQTSLAGEGTSITRELITLEISSPQVPDLTLIDLPGIARVAVGDQPPDIADKTKRLIKTFIAKPETINLVVVPCNVDIATTEALMMAQKVDPDGERTLAVLTKPDLVDKGTEKGVVDVVRNTIIPLKKGYMIVKCRGQQDIKENMPLSSAIQKEREFFTDNEHFSVLLKEKKATIPLLAEKLTSELVKHISKALPDLEKQINSRLQKAHEELRKYSRSVPETEDERLHFFIDFSSTEAFHWVTRCMDVLGEIFDICLIIVILETSSPDGNEKLKLFNEEIANAVQGEEQLSGHDSRLLTKIRKEFQAWDKIIDQRVMNVKNGISQEVRFEEQFRGRELPGFINYTAFENIVKQQIIGLEEPAVQILKKVTEIVQQAFMKVAELHFSDFQNLYKAAKNRIEDIKEKQAEETEAVVRAQFAMEQFLFCQDGVYSQDLITLREQKAKAAAAKRLPINGLKPTEENASFTEIASEDIIYHLKAYFNSAGKRLSCQVPLIVQFYMLKKYGAQLQNEMLQLVQAKEELSTLLQEHKDTAEKKQYLIERINRLNKARHELAIFSA